MKASLYALCLCLASLWGWGPPIALGQAERTPFARPGLYTLPRKEAAPPSYILTGRQACILCWRPEAFKKEEKDWRMRVLDAANMVPQLEVMLHLEDELDLIKNEEAPDGLGTYILLASRDRGRQLVLIYFRYKDGATESERFTVPFEVQVEQLLVSPLGAYVRATTNETPFLLYLNPDSRQAVIVPFGPDKANQLAGCGLEPATGRLWMALVRRGRNPGPTPVVIRAYSLGQLAAEYPVQGFETDYAPQTLYLASDTVGGLWVGTWGKRGSEYSQGPLALQGMRVLSQKRFVDSARFFQFERPAVAARHFARYSRRKRHELHYRMFFHPLQRTATGYRVVGEQYYLRQSANPSPFASPYNAFGYNAVRFYETGFLLSFEYSPAGALRLLHSVSTPTQSFVDLSQRVVALPDRPPLCVERSTPKFGMPDPAEPARMVWAVLQPAALGIGPAQSVSVEQLIEEGPLAYAFGEGRDDRTREPYFFVSRLPEGNHP